MNHEQGTGPVKLGEVGIRVLLVEGCHEARGNATWQTQRKVHKSLCPCNSIRAIDC